MLESVQMVKPGVALGSRTQHRFGICSLPSENINQLMHNDFNTTYLKHKAMHDSDINHAEAF